MVKLLQVLRGSLELHALSVKAEAPSLRPVCTGRRSSASNVDGESTRKITIYSGFTHEKVGGSFNSYVNLYH